MKNIFKTIYDFYLFKRYIKIILDCESILDYPHVKCYTAGGGINSFEIPLKNNLRVFNRSKYNINFLINYLKSHKSVLINIDEDILNVSFVYFGDCPFLNIHVKDY